MIIILFFNYYSFNLVGPLSFLFIRRIWSNLTPTYKQTSCQKPDSMEIFYKLSGYFSGITRIMTVILP